MNSSELSKFKVAVKPFDCAISAPGSKSHANRALICAAFAQEPVTIRNLPESSDVSYLLSCLKEIGLELEKAEEGVILKNSFPECEKIDGSETILETGDGGTTNRFLLPLLALGKKKYMLKPDRMILTRPMEEMISILKRLNIKIEQNVDGIIVQGPPPRKISQIEVDCSQSSQFASGLMMSFQNVHMIFKNLKTSKKYLDLTNHVMREIAQKRQYTVPVDWSSLSYPIALASVMGKVVLKNVKYIDELQGDSVLMKVLRESGAKISMTTEGMLIEKAKLEPFELDCSNCPDLVPTLSFLASTIEESSFLKNIKVLKHKESNRLTELFKLFELFNVDYSYDEKEDTLRVAKGKGQAEAVSYTAPADHRMIMTAYLFMRNHAGGEIENFQHVQKSFPDFFQQMEQVV